LALVILSALGALAVVVLVVGLGILGLEAFASLPNAQHPAPGSRGRPTAPVATGDPTCAAAQRCCTLGEGDADECAGYVTPPLDLDGCRAAIGSYGDAIQQSGGDASPCSPTYAGP
jgi:hypothetical protein